MRSLLILLVAALLPAVASNAKSGARQESDRYIVTFVDLPVASYSGGDLRHKGSLLKATSPRATGERRLDLKSAASLRYREYLADRRHDALSDISKSLGRPPKPIHEFDLALNAVVLILSEAEAERLASHPGVRHVERDGEVELLSDPSARATRADQVWAMPPPVGNRGEGVVIGVIDTGIRVDHPAFAARSPGDGYQHVNPRPGYLGLCLSNPALCNSKLIGVYDFTSCGSAEGASCEDREINDGSDRLYPHGSAVAGVAAGSPMSAGITDYVDPLSTWQISGIAPRAGLISYKMRELTSSFQSWLLAAIEQSIADGVDVLNLSIVTSDTDVWRHSTAMALLAVREANILVATSGGNKSSHPGQISGRAPWTLAAAASRHDRNLTPRLSSFTGGASAPPFAAGILGGNESARAGSPGQLMLSAESPQCRVEGSGESPWGPGQLAGRVIVCHESSASFGWVVNTAVAAGAFGVIVIADPARQRLPDLNVRAPALMIRHADGQALLAWMGSGSSHTARIEAARLEVMPLDGDVMANFSSIGPIYFDVLKPEITAPGQNVLAPSSTSSNIKFFSGTSASAPQLAGAMALIRSAQPAWGVDDVESALLTTARPNLYAADGRRIASAFEQGSGAVDVAAAVRAGLSLRQPIQGFRDADPALGGDPRTLNKPSMVDSRCVDRCAFTRRVNDLVGGGRWRVEIDAPAGMSISVQPQTFSLAPGASQEIAISAEFEGDTRRERWYEGAVRLIPENPDISPARLPLMAFASLGQIARDLRITASSDRGFVDVPMTGISRQTLIRMDAVAPYPITAVEGRVAQHPNAGSMFTIDAAGSRVFWIDVPAGESGRLVFSADLESATAPDVDLLVGLAPAGATVPSQQHLLCQSVSTVSRESCTVDLPNGSAGKRLWVLVHGYRAGAAPGDAFKLTWRLGDLERIDTSALAATGSAAFPAGEGSLRLGWDLPGLAEGKSYYSQLRIDSDEGDRILEIPILIESASALRATRVLAPDRELDFDLKPGERHPGLLVEVPSNASAMSFSSVAHADIHLYAIPAESGPGPGLPSAPAQSQAAASATDAQANKALRISGQVLRPGRWYLVPVNSGSSPRGLKVKVSFEYQPAASLSVPAGAYFNPQRSGAGVFVYDVGTQRALIWFTYLQDGTPTWYLGVAPKPSLNESVWQVELARYSWNGTRATPTAVGNAVLTTTGDSAFSFGWNLDGQSGSEPMVLIGAGACPSVASQALDLSGVWYSPQRSGLGYSVTAGAGIEAQAAYLYDEQGIARWVLASASPFGAETLPALSFTGSCPLCPYQPSTSQAAGSLSRSYSADGSTGTIAVDIRFNAPVVGQWTFELPIIKLTDPVGCG